MKKNVMMRAASALLVAVLLTTCAISGTFAKYVTEETGSDSARVAKWGVAIGVTSDAFKTDYEKTDTTLSGNFSVSAANVAEGETRDKVLAPGTDGTLLTSTITGTPEVAVEVNANATLNLTGWTIPNGETTSDYFPVVFTIGDNTYAMGETASIDTTAKTYTSISALTTAVQDALKIDHVKIGPNTNLADTYNKTVTWAWEYQDTTDGAYQTDEKDTALGNLTTAPQIQIQYNVTVTQVD